MWLWALWCCTNFIWYSFLFGCHYFHCIWFRDVVFISMSACIGFFLLFAVSYDGSILHNFNAWILLRMKTWSSFVKIWVGVNVNAA